jgi:hypothetical protein
VLFFSEFIHQFSRPKIASAIDHQKAPIDLHHPLSHPLAKYPLPADPKRPPARGSRARERAAAGLRARHSRGCRAGRASAPASSVKAEINKAWQELSFSHRNFAASRLRVSPCSRPDRPPATGHDRLPGKPAQAIAQPRPGPRATATIVSLRRRCPTGCQARPARSPAGTGQPERVWNSTSRVSVSLRLCGSFRSFWKSAKTSLCASYTSAFFFS